MQHMIYHLAQLKSNSTATKVWYDLFWNMHLYIVWDLICQLNANKVERIQRLYSCKVLSIMIFLGILVYLHDMLHTCWI